MRAWWLNCARASQAHFCRYGSVHRGRRYGCPTAAVLPPPPPPSVRRGLDALTSRAPQGDDDDVVSSLMPAIYLPLRSDGRFNMLCAARLLGALNCVSSGCLPASYCIAHILAISATARVYIVCLGKMRAVCVGKYRLELYSLRGRETAA